MPHLTFDCAGTTVLDWLNYDRQDWLGQPRPGLLLSECGCEIKKRDSTVEDFRQEKPRAKILARTAATK